jgi:hypothetical protein
MSWYSAAEDGEIEQGEIITSCPMILPVFDPSMSEQLQQAQPGLTVRARSSSVDAIIMSQSCDIASGQKTSIRQVVLCPCVIWSKIKADAKHYLNQGGNRKLLNRGNLGAMMLLAESEVPALEQEKSVVFFADLFVLPIDFVRGTAMQRGSWLRLQPPYREHVSQSFARFFMRVGLPVPYPEVS